MILVARLFPGSRDLETDVWVSDEVREALGEYSPTGKKPGFFLQKLQYWARGGFAKFECKKGCPIRPEWDGVYRIGLHGDLFRVYGFYDGPTKSMFIAVDALMKRGQKPTKAEKQAIDEVARVKRDGDWHRREE